MATAANTPAPTLNEVFVTMSREAAKPPWVSMATGVSEVGEENVTTCTMFNKTFKSKRFRALELDLRSVWALELTI